MNRVIAGLLLLVGFCLPARAAIYTIGPDGAYATVSAAIADADANPDDHDFRLQVGTHVGGVVFAINGAKIWRISGGWNASFTENPTAPAMTTWQAGGLGGTVLVFNLTGTAQLLVQNLTVFGGSGVGQPGGVYGGLANGSLFSLQDCRVTSHQSNAASAGLRIEAAQTSTAEIRRCEFTNNAAHGSGLKFGAGASLRANNSATVLVSNSYFAFNTDSPMSSGTFGGGLFLQGFGDSHLSLLDSVVEDNVVQSNAASGAGLTVELWDDARFDTEAVRVEGNSAPNQTAGNRVQAYVVAFGSSDFEIRNALIANSALGGIYVDHTGTGNGALTNLTIANHDGFGLSYSAASGMHSISNTIVHNNQGSTFGFSVSGAVTRSSNLGDDVAGANNLNPQFVNAINDFHLQSGSPAIDTGNNAFNSAVFDFELNPRVINGIVDIGAYEFQTPPADALFADQFEGLP